MKKVRFVITNGPSTMKESLPMRRNFVNFVCHGKIIASSLVKRLISAMCFLMQYECVRDVSKKPPGTQHSKWPIWKPKTSIEENTEYFNSPQVWI